MLAVPVATTGTSVAQDEFQVEVNECGEQGCESHVQSAEPEPSATPRPAPTAAPEPSGAPPRREVHRYSLKSGKGTVTTDAGTETESLQVDAPEEGDGPSKDDTGKPVKSPTDPTLDSVDTVGGAGVGGAASPFAYVSADEALAQFSVPPFLVPIYVAAGRAYGVPWNVLAAINRIETDFGRNVAVSSAGAVGWMQFMPATWAAYGVDASGDGLADPYNPVDAIYAAARYLRASGAATDLREAVFAYNHADWYVDSVLKTAGVYGSLPAGLVAETGSLAFGRFPVRGTVRYGDDFRRAEQAGERPGGIVISGRPGARVIATQDLTVERVLVAAEDLDALRERDGLGGAPAAPATTRAPGFALEPRGADVIADPVATPALPRPAGFAASPDDGLVGAVLVDGSGNRYTYRGLGRLASGVEPGARIRGGATLGRLPRGGPARLRFAARAAGGAPVDPRPLLDGYRLQEAADFPSALGPLGGNPFLPSATLVANGVIRGNDRQLARRVLDDPGLHIYGCGREDVARGAIDRRILGAMLYLRRAGLELTVTSLTCGHGFYTSGGNVSAHSFGAAMDIAAFNGEPVTGHQGPGSLTEQAIKLLMALPEESRPTQLISLMDLGGPSFSMADHYDHLHVGYSFDPTLGAGRTGNALGTVEFRGNGLARSGKPSLRHEHALSERLGRIANPDVAERSGKGALRVEAEEPDEEAAAEAAARAARPLRAKAAPAGARILDVAAPPAGNGGARYALGVVDGGGREGWADDQVIVLREKEGSWRVLGPPHDASGRIVNPPLRALAVSGDHGYAVGRGAVVRIRGARRPELVPGAGRAPLRAVTARVDGDGVLTGVAAGDRGTILRLEESSVLSRSSAGATSLRALATAGRAVLAVDAGGGLHRVRGDRTERMVGAPRVGDGTVRAQALAARGGDVWTAGAITGAPGEPPRPFAARLSGDGWTTFCSPPPALAGVRELGEAAGDPCDERLLPGLSGGIGDVALTSRGAVLAGPDGLALLRDGAAVPLPGADAWRDSRGTAGLALATDGSGWGALADGGLVRVGGAAQSAAAETAAPVPALPAMGAGDAATALLGGAPAVPAVAVATSAAPAGAPSAAGDLPLKAVATADDGTVVGASGAALLERAADGSWRPAALAPLGLPVIKLAAAREAAGGLRAAVLVRTGDVPALLTGDAGGWTALDVPAGLRVEDFALQRDGSVWVRGVRGGVAVTAVLRAA